jgi:phosphoglycerate dehydrogenase-like enzyme
MRKTKVLFIWDTDNELRRYLKKQFIKEKNINLIFPKNLSQSNILKYSGDADIIIGWRPTKELLKSAVKLKLFINPGTGVKHLIENFREINKQRKVTLVNGHGHAYAVAQHTVAMLLALMNRIIKHHNRMKDGIWRVSDDKDIFSASVQLRNKKIGLLGYGAINKYVHRFLSGFENEFHILKRDFRSEILDFGLKKNKIHKYRENDLQKFLKAIDILIIAVPHTSKTEKMIRKKELKLLGKNSLLVNVARGTIVDEESLYVALKENIIGGAALDVWYNYHPEKNKKGKKYPFRFPFHRLKNILMSPHRAASPFDDLQRWDEVIENIRKVSKGRTDYLNIVDLNEEY